LHPRHCAWDANFTTGLYEFFSAKIDRVEISRLSGVRFIRGSQLGTDNWQLVTANWELTTGNWQLGTDNWELTTGNWQLSTLN
jgi:hypothetical protein